MAEHTFTINIENNLLRESYVGIIDSNVLSKANTAISEHRDFRKGLNFITNLSESNINMGYDEMLSYTMSLAPPWKFQNKHSSQVVIMYLACVGC